MDRQFKFREKIEKYSKGKCNIYTTNCVIKELNLLGETFQPVLQEAKLLKRIKCNHEDDTTPSKCFQRLIGKHNPERYIVATQDFTFKSKVRALIPVPIIYFAQEKLDMTAPSFEHQANL